MCQNVSKLMKKNEKNYHVNRFKMKFDVSSLTQEQRVHIKSPGCLLSPGCDVTAASSVIIANQSSVFI